MDPTQQARKRASQYWYRDGINEIAFGVLFLLLGGYFYLESLLPEGHMLRFLLESSLVLVIIGGGLLLNKLVKLAKERITYPRTGFVTYPRRKAPAWLRAVLALAIAMMMAFIINGFVSSRMEVERWTPGLSGFLIGGALFYIGLRVATLRFLLLSLIGLAIGGGLSLTGAGSNHGLGIFYALLGLAVIFSGSCTLLIYLRSNPEPTEAPDEP